MKQNVLCLNVVLMALFIMMGLSSCVKNQFEDPNKGDKYVGWYLNAEKIPTEANWPMGGLEYVDPQTGQLVAVYAWGDCPRAIHIIDDKKLDYYDERKLFHEDDEKDHNGKDLIYQLQTEESGVLSWYGTPIRITYNRRTDGGIDFAYDNTMVILSVTDNGFERVAGSLGYYAHCKTFIKYDPQLIY